MLSNLTQEGEFMSSNGSSRNKQQKKLERPDQHCDFCNRSYKDVGP